MADEKTFATEYRELLLKQIDKRSNSFTTWFATTLVFSFAFLAFVLIPLVGLQHDEHQIEAKLQQAEAQKASKARDRARFSQTLADIDDQGAEQQRLFEEKQAALQVKKTDCRPASS